MKLPQKIQMNLLMHSSGASGRSTYVYGNMEHGIYQVAQRETSSRPFVDTFVYAHLPHQVFSTFNELCMAAESVTPEQVETEKAKYPVVIATEPVKTDRGYNNACRLCPWVPDRRQKHPEKHRVHLARDGSGFSDAHFGLCDEHLPLTKDPKALVEALQAEADSRKARAAERGGL